MTPLTHEEHLDVLACIGELYRCRSLDAFPSEVVQAVARLVPSTLTAFNEVNLPRRRMVAVTDRDVDGLDRLLPVWERHSAEHPLVRYALETGDGQAVKISDFLSEAEFHRLHLYREFYRVLRAEDQFSITIRSDGGVLIAIAVNRGERDFTERDRVKLNLVRPHLLQAYANVEELARRREERADLETALRETGNGMIAVDDDGAIAHATPGARECLGRYVRSGAAGRSLPGPIADWLETDPDAPFTVRGPTSTLVVRSPRHAERRLLLVSERDTGRLPGVRHLTPRETDVLHWLAEGKSNAEIATILGIAPGTVKQHVEHILAKLGVENRTAASALARDHGLVERR